MVGPEEVAATIMTAWNQSLLRTSTGGLWYGRVDENALAPYGRLVVTPDKLQRFSVNYLRDFVVRISLWGDTGPAGDLSVIRKRVEDVVAGIRLSSLVGRVIDVRPGAGELVVEASPRKANDVCLLSLDWTIKVSGP